LAIAQRTIAQVACGFGDCAINARRGAAPAALGRFHAEWPFSLGTMYFGSETSEQDAFAILDTFVEAGGNLIDTADVYVGGVSE
jgi:aldo/keto reductase family protein